VDDRIYYSSTGIMELLSVCTNMHSCESVHVTKREARAEADASNASSQARAF
jgi:hypothetical protein